MPLQFSHTLPLPPNSYLLGGASTRRPFVLPDSPTVQSLHLQPLQAEDLHECWLVDQPLTSDQQADIRFRYNDEFLFGVIEIPELPLAEGAAGHPLQHAAQTAYEQLFSLLDQKDYPHIWRIWNYLPAINQIEQGTERYRWFNIGRHQAFTRLQREIAFSPAACALGSKDGPLSIAFLASKTPTRRIENPRQVSAFEYPSEYGPKSPIFTRAALATQGDAHLLFISGTASIVNHQTIHAGDIVGQTQETFVNLQTLVKEANLQLHQRQFRLDQFYFKVYLRHPKHLSLVSEIVHKIVGNAFVQYVEADVCRSDLLVEIEAHGWDQPTR